MTELGFESKVASLFLTITLYSDTLTIYVALNKW